MELERISKGAVKHSLRSKFLGDWFLHKHNKMISIPVSVATSLFVFDFEKEVEKMDAFKNRSKESINRMIQLLSKVLNQVDDESLRAMLVESGYVTRDSDDIDDLIMEIKKNVTKSFTSSGIPSAIIKDVFANESNVELLSDLRSLEHADISNGIRIVQSLYGKFATSSSVEDIAAYVQSTYSGNSAMKFIQTLYSIFNLSGGATIQARLTYVLNQVIAGTSGETEIVPLKKIIPGIAYEVESLPYMDELTYKDCVTGFFIGLRTVQGFSTEASNMTIQLSDIIESLVAKTDDFLPAIPDALGVGDIKRVQKAMTTYWMMRVIERMSTMQYGSVENRINAIMDSRKYSRNDAFDRTVRESITAASILFESYLDTAAWMRTMSLDQTVHFTDEHPLRRQQFSDLLFTYLDKFKNFDSRLESTRFLNEGAHVINQLSEQFDYTPNYVLDDEDDGGAQKILENPASWQMTEYFQSEVLSGSILDADIPVNFRVFTVAKPIQAMYSISIPSPDIFGSRDLFKRTLGIMPLDFIIKNTNLSKFILKHSDVFIISTERELMLRFSLPLEVAVKMWRGPGMYLSIRDLQSVLIFWDREVAPIYEVTNTSESRYIPPFLTYYPTLLRRSFGITDITGAKPMSDADASLRVLEVKPAKKKSDVAVVDKVQVKPMSADDAVKDKDDKSSSSSDTGDIGEIPKP